MTVDISDIGDLALPDGPMPWDDDDSLDELKQSEIPTPRLRIDGKNAVFVNSDTAEEYTKLRVIILGLVRSRVFWPDIVEEGGQPYCRSVDAKVGLPTVDDEIPKSKQFPWAKSNFDRKELPLYPGDATQPVASCEECVFAEWDEEKQQFPCTEQLNLPVFYEDRFGNMSPAILTFSSSGFSATTRYLGAIKATKNVRPFMFYTDIELEPHHRGEVDYATPKFIRGEMTERGEMVDIGGGKKAPEFWYEYQTVFNEAKEFLRRPRRRSNDVEASEPEPEETPKEAPKAAAKKPAPKRTAPKKAAAQEEIIDAEVEPDPPEAPAEEPAPEEDDVF